MGGLTLMTTLDYMLRMVVASMCGFAIGIERKNRLKEAGTRTHLIVALGSALIAIVSKYGFFDLAQYSFIGLDPSRTIAQVVSGIGFLGAGMIFLRHQSVTGLTTAAGVWTTAGIGVAVGCGLYVIGIFATVLVLVVQLALHSETRWMKLPGFMPLELRVQETPESLAKILCCISNIGAEVVNMELTRKKAGFTRLDLFLRLPAGVNPADVVSKLNTVEDVVHIDT